MTGVEFVGILFGMVILLRWGPGVALVWLIPYQGIVGGFNLALSDALLPIVIMVCGCRWWLSKPKVQCPDRRVGIVWLALYAMSAAAVVSLSTAGILWGHQIDLSAAVLSGLKLIVGGAYATTVGYIVWSEYREGRSVTLEAWSWSATFISLVGLAGLGFPQVGVPLGLVKGGRVNSTFDDANLFASYLIVSLALLGVLTVCKSGKVHGGQIAVLLVALLASGSRAVAPAIAVGLVCALILGGRGRLLLRAGGIVLVCIPVLLVAASLGGLEYADSPLSRTFEGDLDVRDDPRWPLWMAALSMWKHNPLVGVGLGQYQMRSWEFVTSGIDNVPHSTLLSFAAEMGVLGVLAFLLLPVILAVRLARISRSHKTLGESYLLFGIFALGVQALTINIENSRMLWAFFGISWAWWRLRGTDALGTVWRTPSVSRASRKGCLPHGAIRLGPAIELSNVPKKAG